MTLKELRHSIDMVYQSHPQDADDLIVGIPNNKKGILGGKPITGIKSVCKGFDWDAGTFFLIPEVKMIEQGDADVT